MGFFGKKEEKAFISNDKLVEVIKNTENSKILSTLEDEIEKRYLYRNVEKIDYLISGGAVVKYKDLKVRTEMEVKLLKEKLRKEAGLDLGR
jgi:putative DNA-binding response regulator